MSIDNRVIIFAHVLSLLCNVLFTYFACNDHSLFKLLTSLHFFQLKNLNKDEVFLPTCFTFLNSVRLTSPHQNTQKSLAAPSANTKVYKLHCCWGSVKQYEKNTSYPNVNSSLLQQNSLSYTYDN